MRLIIVGAGGFGREILTWAYDSCRDGGLVDGEPCEVAGFLDDNPSALDGFEVGVEHLGSVDNYVPQDTDRFVIAIGNPAIRMGIARSMESKGWKFVTIKHPTAIVGPRVKLGHGCILCPYSVVTTDIVIGNHVIVNVHAIVGHDSKVGSGCTINGLCEITGRCEIGEGVAMGTHASLIPGRHVGDYAVIGAGSVVIKHVKSRSTVFGVPATSIFEAD
jgi:sugar O-acyltransferase (sialic acid O-acetyltransferase NeuD family)